jgi:hypothetical protein
LLTVSGIVSDRVGPQPDEAARARCCWAARTPYGAASISAAHSRWMARSRPARSGREAATLSGSGTVTATPL